MNVYQDRTEEIKKELAELHQLKVKAKEHKRNLSKMKAGRYSVGNEYEIQDRLEAYFISNQIPYKREVKIIYGRIDFMTESHLYEVKKLWNKSDLFNAIGQLTYYNRCHNDKFILSLCSEHFTPDQLDLLKTLNIEAEVI